MDHFVAQGKLTFYDLFDPGFKVPMSLMVSMKLFKTSKKVDKMLIRHSSQSLMVTIILR